MSPGSTVRFQRITWAEARRLDHDLTKWLKDIEHFVSNPSSLTPSFSVHIDADSETQDPKLLVIPSREGTDSPRVVFRQAGDSAILIEYGPMMLDFSLRARIHAFESAARRRNIPGLRAFCPCIRSTMVSLCARLCKRDLNILQCIYDPSIIYQSSLLQELLAIERGLPDSVMDMEFPARRLSLA